MARKLNKRLVGVLTLCGMLALAVIGIAMVMKLPGQDPKKYELEARKFEEAGDYNRAMQAYSRAFGKSGSSNIEYLVMAARCAVEDGKLAQAFEFLGQALLRESESASALKLSTQLHFELAKMVGERGQWLPVLENAQKLEKVEAESPLAHHALGLAYLNLRTDDDSYAGLGETHLQRALELDPTNVDIVKDVVEQSWLSARQKWAAGLKAEAEALQKSAESTLASAIEKSDSLDAPERVAELRELQARLMIQKGEREAGLELLKQLAEGETKRASAHLLLAKMHTVADPGRTEPDFEKAAEVAEAGLTVDSKNAELYTFLGEVYRRAGKLPEAEGAYRRALEAIPYRRDHFRFLKDNRYRVGFISQLFMMDLDRVVRAKLASDESQEAGAVAAAENWITVLKGELNEKDLTVLLLNAQLYKAKGDYVAATREAEAANRIGGADRHFLLQTLLSELYMRQQAWGAAKKSLQNVLILQPGSPQLWIWLGSVHLELGAPADALRCLKPSEPGPLRDFLLTNVEATKLRIRAYEELKQFDEAASEKWTLPSEMVENPLFQADRLVAQGKEQEAEQVLKEALEKSPDNTDLLRAIVQLYASTKRSEEARSLLAPRLAKDPDNQMLRGMEIALGADDPANDQKIVEWINTEKDGFRRAMQLADFYRSRKNLQEEVKRLDEAERLRPEDATVIERQFLSAAQAKDWSRAEKYVARNGELNLDGTEGKVPGGRLALARAAAYEAENRSDEAKAEVERAIGLLKSGLAQYPSSSTGWTFLAEAYLKVGGIEDAESALGRALAIDPTDGMANRGMALIAMYQKNEKDEERYLARAAKSLPNDSWIATRLQLAKEKENPKEGIARREKTRREDPKNLENLVFLARLYGDPKVADYDRASEAYREALALAKDDLGLAREFAAFLGSEEVNRPAQGEELLKNLINTAEGDPPKKALLLVYLGQLYEGQRVLATAERHFRMAVSFDPSVRILLLAAEFCSRTNRVRDALEYYERALRQMEQDSDAAKSTCSRMIGLLLAQGDLESAKEKIAAYTQKYPDDPQGLVFEGAWHRMGGDIQKAKERFDEFLSKHPDSALVLWQRGQLHMLMGQWQAALADLKNASVNNRDGFGYQHRVSLANCLVEAGRDDEAISELKAILEEHAEEQGVAEVLANIYLRVRPPRYSDAETLIIRRMRTYPNETRWPMLLGRLGKQSGDAKKAVDGYEAAANVSRYREGTVTALFAAYRSAKRAKDLIRFADEKVPAQILSAQPEALVHLAWAYSQTGDERKCFETYDRALAAAKDFRQQNLVASEMSGVFGKEAVLARCKGRLDAEPDNLSNLEVYAHLLFMSGQREEALQICVRIGQLAVTGEDKIFAVLAQGMVLDSMGRYPEAKGKYEEALKIDPQQGMALNNLAYLLVERMDNAAEALPYARQAQRLNPNDPGVLDTLGWTLARNRQWGEATGMLLRAIEIDRENTAALYHLAMTHRARGEFEEAKQRLAEAQKAAEAQGNQDLLPKIREALNDLEKAGGR